MRRRSHVLLPILLLPWACEAPPQEHAPLPGSSWTFDSTAVILAGSIGAPAELSFNRIGDIVRLQDGRVVVADGGLGSSRLTVLTPQGELAGSIGRNGEGPGEFGWVTDIHAGGADTLFVFDAGQQRLTAFSHVGEVLRTATHHPVGGERLKSAVPWADEVWLGRGLDSPQRAANNQLAQDTIPIGLLDPGLEQLDVLWRAPSLMTRTLRIGGQVGLGAAPFTPLALHATWGRCVFVSDGAGPEIRVYSSDGELLRSIAGPGELRPVTEQHLDTFAQFRLRGVPEGQRAALRDALREAAHPASLPYYREMLADDRGRLWMQVYAPPMGLARDWYVLDQSGAVLDQITLPRAMRVFETDARGLLGVVSGEFDEEMIAEIRLVSRPATDGEQLAECQP